MGSTRDEQMGDGPSLGRRPFLAGAAVAGAAAWVAPVVLGVDAAAAATPMAVVVVATGASGTIISSPDAVAWTERTSGTTNNLKGVFWSPTLTLYAAVGAGGTIVTSPDGITWTVRTSPTSRELNAITWDADGAQFVAVGNARTVVTSTDGTTWVLQTSGIVGDPDYLGVAADGVGTLVAVGTGGLVDRSTDGGATWSAGIAGGITSDVLAVEWSGDATAFIAVGAAGVAISSSDGDLWSLGVTSTTNDLVAVEWSDPLDELVVIEADATGQVLRSTDGGSWTASPVGAALKAIAYSASLALYIAVGTTGAVWTGPTATGPWTSQTSPTTQNLLAVVASS